MPCQSLRQRDFIEVYCRSGSIFDTIKPAAAIALRFFPPILAVCHVVLVPFSRIGRVRSNEKIVFLIGDEVHPAHVHRLVASIEANVTLFGLARVTGRPNDQPLYVIENPFVLRV